MKKIAFTFQREPKEVNISSFPFWELLLKYAVVACFSIHTISIKVKSIHCHYHYIIIAVC